MGKHSSSSGRVDAEQLVAKSLRQQMDAAAERDSEVHFLHPPLSLGISLGSPNIQHCFFSLSFPSFVLVCLFFSFHSTDCSPPLVLVTHVHYAIWTPIQVKSVLATLLHAQEAMEGSFTCMQCMSLFVQPHTYVTTNLTITSFLSSSSQSTTTFFSQPSSNAPPPPSSTPFVITNSTTTTTITFTTKSITTTTTTTTIFNITIFIINTTLLVLMFFFCKQMLSVWSHLVRRVHHRRQMSGVQAIARYQPIHVCVCVCVCVFCMCAHLVEIELSLFEL
jgi:hypothetical protein